jgi:meso-butanediol dehydrogenase/(S,S)-butanediol dehydrogenase/diacetyl reductase
VPRLEGKVALITGTAGGQGAAAARLFAAEGANVIGCDLDQERATAVAEQVRGTGARMTAFAPIDLADPEAATGAKHGIRANSISPGLIVTPQIAQFIDEPGDPVHEMARTHPLGRLGESDDVARVALFLASDDAAYLNAVDIVVDGGQSVIS